jgi:hypothetical protein
MHLSRALCYLFCCFALAVFIASAYGCAKDYSYEYKPGDTTSPVNTAPMTATFCQACTATALPDSSWRFTIDGVIYCGQAVKPVTLPERTAFTFFGPSSCSADSGFAASVFLGNHVLNADKTNLSGQMTCYYYDKVGPSHVYMSSSSESLQVTVTTYVHQTGAATGTFRGVVFDGSGRRKEVRDGRFRIRL